MTSKALASLTETYTDSEGEESTPKEHVNEVECPRSPEEFPQEGWKKPTTLVSYNSQEDTIISDDEHHGTPIAESPTVEEPAPMEISAPSVSFDDVDMPPEPTGICPPELTEKIIEITRKINENGYDMNLVIQQRKTFRNPSIYERLIDHCKINEFGTNYDPRIYDPLKWDKSSYYDELGKLQKADMEKREKERREKTKIEVLTGTAKKVSNGTASEEDIVKRKSKWDQVVFSAQSAARIQPGIATLTSTASGTRGVVISAFGSLPRKP